MDPMVTWLNDCLDEIERVAVASRLDGAGTWNHDCRPNDRELPCDHDLCAMVSGDITIYDEGGHDARDAAHIALNDPRGVLARVEAEKLLSQDLVEIRDSAMARFEYGDPGLEHMADQQLRLLAYGHRHDFPGYDPAWTPDGTS